MNGPLIVKCGGELLESPEQRARVSAMAAGIASHRPLVIVHGGGRAIDAELDRRGIAPKKVDGLRITDEPTLDVVVSVLGGSANTELVASLVGQGVTAVGLTGVDAGFGRAVRTSAYQSVAGSVVDLGLVGDPLGVEASLIELLLVHGYVPVIASLGLDDSPTATGVSAPRILNVNADVMACRITAALSPSELVIAGTTPGVLDEHGESIPMLDAAGIDAVIASGTATAGMIAKLTACKAALVAGATTVRIVDGRLFDHDYGVDDAPGTTLVLTPKTAGKSVA